VPKSDDSPAPVRLEPSRRQLILERLQNNFYAEAVPSERIATAVLAALRDFDKGSAFPH
jgi:hypothetical protein